ncbi:hypothetical protein WME89_29445 [Sorangium sp. So ce321]|uniref:hypothetical protein n=1 Tax=Sorangium sp. So ce321 TaxID=3133300 RepID=UPI003F613FF3
MGKREQMIQIAARIQALRSELAELEFQFDLLLESDAGPVSPRSPHEATAATPHEAEASAASRIVALLDEIPSRDFGVTEIAKMLQLTNVQSVRAALARLARDGKISKAAARGRYRSASRLRLADAADYDGEDENELDMLLQRPAHDGLNGASYSTEAVADE